MEIQWSLVLFTVLSGAGAWLFASAAIDEFKGTTKKTAFPAAILAVVLLAVGGICSVTHLSHPERMLAALGHPTAGIFLEALLLGILAVVAIVYAILVKREASAGARKIFAVLGIIALLCRQEILLFIMGGVFVMETISVILQVGSYKMRGRRIFRMAPIHHHFEKGGWPEPRVFMRFWIVTLVLVLIGLITLKLR